MAAATSKFMPKDSQVSISISRNNDTSFIDGRHQAGSSDFFGELVMSVCLSVVAVCLPVCPVGGELRLN